jgi:hypothetical protein
MCIQVIPTGREITFSPGIEKSLGFNIQPER